MILRKTPSVFLRTLRAISPDALPALPTKKLSAAQTKRLENAVFSRIAAEQNTSVFTMTEEADSYDRFDAPYESTPIGGKAAWRDFAKMAVTACLCFALLASVVLIGGRLARLTGAGQTTDTQERDHNTTNALYWESDLPETGVTPPYESAEGFSLFVNEVDTGIGQLSLSLQLNTEQPMEGISVQYHRVILSRWDSSKEQFEILYDYSIPYQPKLEILAGDVHFPIIGMGQTTTAEGILTVSRDLRGQAGLYFITLEGLTLVADADVESADSYEEALIATVLTDSTVCGRFSIFPESTLENTPDETLPPRNTVTGPPEHVWAPTVTADGFSLTVKNESITNNAVTLGLRLESEEPLPGDSYAVFYKYCDIALWNHELQIWEGKYGTDDADAPFINMTMAGDIHFLVDGKKGVADASLPFTLPDDGWYRITLRGLVLVREARDGEDAKWNLVCEPLDDGAVYAVFHKE